MKRFADLLDSLIYTPSRNGKIRQLAEYFAETPDPDRGWALAALTGALSLPGAKPATVRGLVTERVDEELFRLSYDYVGDLAETTALIWPEAERGDNRPPPALSEIVDELRAAGRGGVPPLLAGWLDRLDATGRWALLKFLMGGLRIGVSARLARVALSHWSDIPVEEIEEVWHGIDPPYGELFAWLEGQSGRPDIDRRAIFRPMMLANPIELPELSKLDPADFLAEWKWDGIRVQIAARGGAVRMFSRTGDEIGGAFPDLVETIAFDGVIDGELLVFQAGDGGFEPAPFNRLQQRLNRKTVTRAMLKDAPVFVRAYDILFDGDEDLRGLPLQDRRARLEAFAAREACERIDLSDVISFACWDELAGLRDGARGDGREGLMLKRRDSLYVAGRPKGPWFKWKRDALTLDCVLMYAQRGHGRRSSYYSDYTFGVWREGELVPVGKAYSGYSDADLARLDKWVREHTVDRYGPVRAVETGLVFEVAFDSVHPSTRHKSGVAMRFPRIHRIRWDKPPEEADTIETVGALVEG